MTDQTKNYKVLILGAGASMPYGYPSGAMLRRKILSIGEGEAKRAGVIIRDNFKSTRAFNDFKQAFRLSQKVSIDAFLGTRTEFADIGKKCIASVLMQCEKEDALYDETDGKDHWYQYFVNSITNTDWKNLDFSGIAIITFNYDRSLQLFLHTTLQHIYGKNSADVVQKLRELRIVNVYGSLCDKYPDEDGWIEYGGELHFDKINAAAKALNVIPEGRIQGETLVEARSLIGDAFSVAFLGFGFDPINMERLSADRTFRSMIKRPDAMHTRSVSGTAKGMTTREIQRACQEMNKGESYPRFTPDYFHDMTCTEYLRHTLFLDR